MLGKTQTPSVSIGENSWQSVFHFRFDKVSFLSSNQNELSPKLSSREWRLARFLSINFPRVSALDLKKEFKNIEKEFIILV